MAGVLGRWKVGDRIIAGETDEEREDGRILEIDGDRLLIAWRQGVRTWTDAADVGTPHEFESDL